MIALDPIAYLEELDYREQRIHNAKEVCRVKIHVTDTDAIACAQLQEEMKTASGIELSIGRLVIGRWIEDYTLRMIDAHKRSHSLLAFCGSSNLAQEFHQQKISNDMIKAVTGYRRHQMDFVSESYGGASKKNMDKIYKEATAQGHEQESETPKSLNRFSAMSYERGHRDVASQYSGQSSMWLQSLLLWTDPRGSKRKEL